MVDKKFVGVDLFAGAGGMSIGAIAAGIEVKAAVEIDKYAAYTFSKNHLSTKLFNEDIRRVTLDNILKKNKKEVRILFGGPPCQGFSTSNQKTRNKKNETNWLFQEYLRLVKEQMPDWIIVENVKGIIETENGYFFEKIDLDVRMLGYTTNYAVLNAADFGVPQVRNRVFLVGSLHGIKYKFPEPTTLDHITVKEAISDLPKLENGCLLQEADYFTEPQGNYQLILRNGSVKSVNNNVTRNANFIVERYKHIPQGGNWENIPDNLMENYKDHTRCHTGIYRRLDFNKPSTVIGNYRKNMLIHPIENRGLSVREAARIQSFPDTFHFYGSVGFQQQQVGNSVPPKLAEHIFKEIISY